MQRRRSVPHTFEENIAAEKAKLEAQVAKEMRTRSCRSQSICALER